MTAALIKAPSDPGWHNVPDQQEWLASMGMYLPQGDIDRQANAAVFSTSAAIAHVLKATGDDLSRENILRQMTNL